MSRTILLCPPAYFEVRDRKNPYMRASVDRAKAQLQWESLRQRLQESGLKVEIIDAVEGLEDMVFAANPVFVGYHQTIGKFIVPSEMRHHSRQKEVPFYVDWFSTRGYTVIALDLVGECLEGHGDLLWHPGQPRIWAGYGFRSTRGGIEKFAGRMQELGFTVTPLQLRDEYFYHLDTCFCPLNSEAALLYPAAFSEGAIQSLRQGWKRLHELDREEAVQFMCNGVVANGSYFVSHAGPRLLAALQREGLKAVLIDTSEFEKSGGGVFCMKAFLD